MSSSPLAELGLGIGGTFLPPETLAETHSALQLALNRQSVILPEVEYNYYDLLTAGGQLIDTFQLAPELFDDEARSLVFTSIAHTWAGLANTHGYRQDEEQEFATNALILLAHDYSPAIEPVKDELYKDIFDINDSHTREVIDRYTDPRLSRDLSTRIDRGLLEDVKEKMHVTTDNETPYEIAVLSLDSPHGSAHATIPSPESENSDMRDLIKEWRKGLNRRFEQFNNRLGRERPLNARAWVCIGNNQQSSSLMCIPMPLAEKLMHPELIQPTLRSRKAIYAGDLAILGHEYVHSQGFLGIDRKLWFGCSLEERRADFFSGKDSYYMVTEFFHNLRLATGFDLNTYYANAPKGGTIAELSTALAKNLGLRTMLEILLRPPGNYLRDQSNTYQQFCTQYAGNYNDIVNAAVLSEVQQGRETSIADRCRYLVQMALPRIAECPDKFPTFLQYENGLSEGLARIVFNAALELRTAHAL